jgi:ligand-binding sensor domain-containing protein
LLVDRDQVLWVGTQHGIERWTLEGRYPQRRVMGAAQGLPQSPVKRIYQDQDGTMWVGSQTGGLFRWREADDRFVQYRHQQGDPHSIADNYVFSLFRDNVGTLWVGTWYRGVSRVDLGSGGFARLVKDPGQPFTLTDNKVRALLDAGDGKIWVGNSDGLNYYDPVTGKTVLYRTGSAGDSLEFQVTALMHDPRDRNVLWVGSRNGVCAASTSRRAALAR